MFKFTIRELLILTVTAGLAVGWCRYHQVAVSRHQILTSELEKARNSGLAAWHHMLELERDWKKHLAECRSEPPH